MKRTLILLAVLLFMAGNAMAGRTYVLVAAVSNYQNSSADLPTTTNDAKRVAKLWQRHSQDVSLITSRYATREKLLSKLQEIAVAANSDDRIVFFFSGHGSDGCIIAYDMNPVYYTEIIDILAASKAGNKQVFIDACKAGSATGIGQNDRWREKLANGNIVFMLASRGEELSVADNFMMAGWFSHAYLKGIEGRADANSDRIVTVMELFTYIYNDVTSRSKNKQHPQLIATKEHQNDTVLTW